MSAERGNVTEDMMGAILFKRAPADVVIHPYGRIHKVGETAHLEARMNSALSGANPSDVEVEAQGVIDVLEAEQAKRLHRKEDHKLALEEQGWAERPDEPDYDYQARRGESPVLRDEYGFAVTPRRAGW